APILPPPPTPPVLQPPPPPPPPVIQPPPPPPAKPDLAIVNASFAEFTVRNQGLGAAGPFIVTVSQSGSVIATHQFPAGLAAGAQATRSIGLCTAPVSTIVADAGSTVDESNETNNSVTTAVPIC
ncbi:MAG: CARDB domain-containing protein, partial [Solirubrobacteraceae bacterium]